MDEKREPLDPNLSLSKKKPAGGERQVVGGARLVVLMVACTLAAVGSDALVERADNEYPTTYGINLDEAGWHPNKQFRPGQASDDHSCDSVRAVPEDLRPSNVVGIHESYTKYTEAYGIPIVGSSNVTDMGLSRACYTIRMMLASRYDIRNAIYKLFNKVAIIGDGEQQTDLHDYRGYTKDWDERARGLGATIGVPTTSSGDDNQRCITSERYPHTDIMIHEFAHTVHLLGAVYTLPSFHTRLNDAYLAAKEADKYGGNYMIKNRNEYFAEGSVIYFNSFLDNTYNIDAENGTKIQITNRKLLQEYDPGLVELLDEVYSCHSIREAYVPRCCTLDYFPVRHPGKKPTGCDIVKSFHLTLWACVARACSHGVTVFDHKGTTGKSTCRLYDCKSTPVAEIELKSDENSTTYMTSSAPWKFNVADLDTNFDQLCISNNNTPEDCDVDSQDRTQCGPETQTADQCLKRGCCVDEDNGGCYYRKQDCIDTDADGGCPEMAISGKCVTNPGYMHRKCQLSCDLCETGSPYGSGENLTSLCQDTSAHCRFWIKSKYCTHEKYGPQVKKTCELGCGVCKPNWPGASGGSLIRVMFMELVKQLFICYIVYQLLGLLF